MSTNMQHNRDEWLFKLSLSAGLEIPSHRSRHVDMISEKRRTRDELIAAVRFSDGVRGPSGEVETQDDGGWESQTRTAATMDLRHGDQIQCNASRG